MARHRASHHPLALALATALAAPLAQGQALPTGEQLPVVGAVINRSGTAMTIDQSEPGVIINWESFSIAAGNSVTFNQPATTSVALNRVIGTAAAGVPPSLINGSLFANGRVFLVNPGNIVFGAGSQVSVGGLVASTLDITDADFLAGVGSGHFVFNVDPEEGAGSINNLGSLLATGLGGGQGQGTIALLAGEIFNAGQVQAENGTIAMASSQQVTLDFFGDGLTQVTVTLGTDDGSIDNAGLIQANGGRVEMRTNSDDGLPGSFGFIQNTGIIRANTLNSRNGRITLDAGAGQVLIGDDSDGTTGGVVEATGLAAGETGGTIDIHGDMVFIVGEEPDEVSRIDASGHSGGGAISIDSTYLTLVGSESATDTLPGVEVRSDATAAGTAGQVTFSNGGVARDGVTGGIVISGTALLSASGAGSAVGGVVRLTSTSGQIALTDTVNETFAGTVDVFTNGASGGTIEVDAATNLFASPGTQLIADATGGGSGGHIRTASSNLLDIRAIDAHAGSPNGSGLWEIESGGNLAIVHTDEESLGEFGSIGGYSLVSDTSIAGALSTATNVAITVPAPAQGAAQINIEPEVAINSTAPVATSFSLLADGGQVIAGVEDLLDDAGAPVTVIGPWSIISSAGPLNVGIEALSSIGLYQGTVQTAGGAIGLLSRNSSTFGVEVEDTTLTSGGGAIVVTGHGVTATGVSIGSGSTLSSGGGDIRINGYSDGASAGVIVAGAGDAGAGNIVLRAGNDGSSDALVLDGSLHSDAVVNLRPGQVDAAGNAFDRVDDAITVGGATGFALSAAEVANIDAVDLVLGHAGHAGAITVTQALQLGANLTLHNAGGAGGIALNAPVDVGAGTLALVSAGNIGQTAAGAITAASLLAQSTGGSVALSTAANNVAGTTLAGGAVGDFSYTDVDALTIGNVSARGFDAAGAAAQVLASSGISAGTVFVRNLAGNLTLNAGVSAGTDLDLVTAGTLQNLASAALSAGNRWRVWADTWVGETRGGLAGSGPLPNLYNCSFAGACGVAVPAADNHFIYRQQPVATVTIDSATREYGLANPTFAFTVAGLINGDTQPNAVNGSVGTSATQLSNVGDYPIDGLFLSPAGYSISLVPGSLLITPATLTYIANPLTRFLGQANGPLSGAVVGFRNADTLATATTGELMFRSAANELSPVGRYAIEGTGLSAINYVFVQDPRNATALLVNALASTLFSPELVREPPDNYLYDRNIGQAQVCSAVDVMAGTQDKMGDNLAREWSRVRSRPNLISCVQSNKRYGCSDF